MRDKLQLVTISGGYARRFIETTSKDRVGSPTSSQSSNSIRAVITTPSISWNPGRRSMAQETIVLTQINALSTLQRFSIHRGAVRNYKTKRLGHVRLV